MPEPASPASESSKSVPVGEPPTPEGWTIYVCPECGEHIEDSDYTTERGRIWGHYHDPPEGWHTDDGPPREDPWFDAVPIRVAPVGGAGQEDRVREATRILHLSTDKPWELIYAARRVLVGEQDGVGGTGVRLTDEEAIGVMAGAIKGRYPRARMDAEELREDCRVAYAALRAASAGGSE